MKNVEGRSLEAAIAETRNLEERLMLLPVLTAVVDAMAYAHRQGIVHCDLKPANILVGEYGEIVVIGWGMATELRAADGQEEEWQGTATPRSLPDETDALEMPGTPGYTAPERMHGTPVDERADVYGLGALLYEILTGKRPFAERQAATGALAKMQDTPSPIVRFGIVRTLFGTKRDRAFLRDIRSIVDKAWRGILPIAFARLASWSSLCADARSAEGPSPH
jgi:serine/threonine protein kinase